MVALVHVGSYFGVFWESEACSIDTIELPLGPLHGSDWVGMLFFRDGVGRNSQEITMDPFWRSRFSVC